MVLGRRFWQGLAGLVLALVAAAALAFEPPAFQGDVLDEVGVLDAAERARLEQRIRDLRDDTGIWAAIYVTRSLQDGSIEAAAADTFARWQLGQRGEDNGLLVLVAPNERKMRIELGSGLTATIGDALCQQVIDEIYKPAFRDRHFAAGLLEGFERLAGSMPPAAADNTLDVAWGPFFQRWFGVWLANLALAALYWAIRRRRAGGSRVRDAVIVFAFLGGVFGLFAAVFGAAFPDDREVLPGLFGANGIIGLLFLIPMWRGGSYSSSSSDDDDASDDDWRRHSRTSSSSWDSDSSSSSDGGSSGGGGASGDY